MISAAMRPAQDSYATCSVGAAKAIDAGIAISTDSELRPGGDDVNRGMLPRR